MAKYGSPDLAISVGGDNMEEYIHEIGELTKEAIIQEGHTFGDEWVKQYFTGVKQANEFTVSGFYDDTALTGPDAVFDNIGDTVEIIISWGGSKTTTFDAIIKSYGRAPSRGELTGYSCALVPTGVVQEV